MLIKAIPHRQRFGLLRPIQLRGGFEGLTQQTCRRERHVPWNRNAITEIAQPGCTPRWRRAGRVADQLGQCTAQGLVKGLSTHWIHVPKPLLVTDHPAKGDGGLIGLIHLIPTGLILAKTIFAYALIGRGE